MTEVLIVDTDTYQIFENTSGGDPDAPGYWRSRRFQWKPGNVPPIEQVINKLQNALAVNTDYLNNNTPTAGQVAAQVKLLTREVNGLIRITLNALDTITDV